MSFGLLFDDYHHAQDRASKRQALDEARRQFAESPADGANAIRSALAGTHWQRLWAAAVFRQFKIPEELRPQFVLTALRCGDPSDNRAFVDALVFTLGPTDTARSIIKAVSRGSDDDVVGAAAALYWLLPHGPLPGVAKRFLLRKLLTARSRPVRSNVWSVLRQ